VHSFIHSLACGCAGAHEDDSPKDDGVFVLLGDGDGDAPAPAKRREEDFVGHDVELLLVVAWKGESDRVNVSNCASVCLQW
jgi:hypothetical protein